jgi:hypothetical protein
MEKFNRNILKIIEKFEQDLFVVQQDFSIKCLCRNFDTKQPDPKCKKCLGTGHKIKIRKIKGAKQDTSIPNAQRPINELIIASLYFIKSEYPVYQDNLIIDNDEVLYIYQRRRAASFKGEEVYQKCMAMPKKLDYKAFIENFNSIVGRKEINYDINKI